MTVDKGGKDGKGTTVRRTFSQTGACARGARHGPGHRNRPVAAVRRLQVASRGAITIPGYTADGWAVRIIGQSGFVDPDKPIRDYTERELDDFLYHEPVKVKIEKINATYEGLVPKLQKSLLAKTARPCSRTSGRSWIGRWPSPPARTAGTRLSEGARSAKIAGISIAEACAMQISDLAGWVAAVDEAEVAPLVGALRNTLDSFVQIGLGYLSLDGSSGDALRGRGAANEDGPAPRLGADRCHLCLRRADDRPAPARHRPHERVAAAASRQGATRCSWSSTSRRRLRSPTTSSTSVPALARPGPGVLPGHRRGAARQQDTHGSPSGRPSRREAGGPPAHWAAGNQGRQPAQPAGCRCRRAVGVLVAVTGVAGSGKSSLIHGSLPPEAG